MAQPHPWLVPREYDETYRVTSAITLACLWVCGTLAYIWRGTKRPQGASLVAFAAITRLVRTYVGSCLVPFMTNVVRDHKCREWVDVPRSILITVVYKLFYGMQDIADVLMVVSFDWRVYVALILCDAIASSLSTLHFLRAKQRLNDERSLPF